MDIDEEVIGTWPNVAIEAGADLKAMKPEPMENRSVFDEDEESEATPAQFADAPKDILNGESYKFDDTREQLEAWAHDEIAEKWAQSDREVTMIMDDLLDMLDRQTAITRKECDRPSWDYCETCEALAELTAERDKLKAEVETYRDYEKAEFFIPLDEAMKFTTDPPGYVKKRIVELQAERAELLHANSLLQSTIAELGLKVDEKQAELLEARASRKGDAVGIQLALARFAEEWTTTDTRAQEQRLITYYAQHIAQLVDNHTENA